MTDTWLSPVAAAPVVQLHPCTVRTHANSDRLHGHNDRRGDRSGEWWFHRRVLELVAGGPVPIPEQVVRCGCSRPGFTPPPARAGYARRRTP